MFWRCQRRYIVKTDVLQVSEGHNLVKADVLEVSDVEHLVKKTNVLVDSECQNLVNNLCFGGLSVPKPHKNRCVGGFRVPSHRKILCLDVSECQRLVKIDVWEVS